jgi:hypothetical protein
MPISHKTIKLLWASAAGRCSYPGCQENLVPLLKKSASTVVGEMAHVIGRTASAARNDAKVGGDDSYENLILLCPTHHTLIDKADKDFPVDLLKQWKADWEGHVSASFPQVVDRASLFHEIYYRLIENQRIHAEWGPTSDRATVSPQSSQSASYWQLRRLVVIVPNNHSIKNLLKANKHLLTPMEQTVSAEFIEHAEFFASHCIEPRDSTAYLPFPKAFSDMVFREVSIG